MSYWQCPLPYRFSVLIRSHLLIVDLRAWNTDVPNFLCAMYSTQFLTFSSIRFHLVLYVDPWSSWIWTLDKEIKMNQFAVFLHANCHVNKLKGKKSHNYLTEHWKSLRWNPTALNGKGIREIKDTGHIPKHNQSNIQQGYIQHQTEWKSLPLESGQDCPLSPYILNIL